MQISNCRLGGLLSAPKQHIVQESATIHASVKLILTCLRRDVCYMLWFISCTKSTGRNIFTPVISKGLSWRQMCPSPSLHLRNGGRGCQRLAKAIKKSRVLLCARNFMLSKFLGKPGSCWVTNLMCHLD